MSMQVILAQALLGLNVGVFYAMLSLGLAVIFGLLNIINFAHGAMYMLGAFIALIGYSLLERWFGISLQIGFWASPACALPSGPADTLPPGPHRFASPSRLATTPRRSG